MTNTDIARITNTNAIVLDMLNMDELVHEADCLAQGLRELLSGTTHAGQEAQKYLRTGKPSFNHSKAVGQQLEAKGSSGIFLGPEGRGCLQRHLHVLRQTE